MYNKEQAIIAQNSATNATSLAAAIIRANADKKTTTESAKALFDDLQRHIFDRSCHLAGIETAARDLGATVTGERPSAAPSSGGSSGSVAFKTGKHNGKTIAEVDAIPADENGKNSGRSYIEWAAEKMNNAYMKRACREYLDALG